MESTFSWKAQRIMSALPGHNRSVKGKCCFEEVLIFISSLVKLIKRHSNHCISKINEPRHEKTNILHYAKTKLRS